MYLKALRSIRWQIGDLTLLGTILSSAHALNDFELVISGESRFYAGVGVAVFSLLLGMISKGATPTLADRFEM